jgi:hypothetical protein
MYNFTEGSVDATTGHSYPKWHQIGVMVDYFLSKRTDVYAQGTYQHVRDGQEGSVFDQANITGSAGPSSTRTQLLRPRGLKTCILRNPRSGRLTGARFLTSPLLQLAVSRYCFSN